MRECQTCGGRYAASTIDGQAYYHRCPPLSAAELQAAVDRGLVTLPVDETADDAVLRRTYERAQLRDENIRGGKGDDRHDPIAEGAGAIDVAAPAAPARIVVDW